MNVTESKPKDADPRLWHLAREYAEQFQDQSVVDAYHLRPYYPEETFAILARLCDPECQRALDVGCGSGEIARRLASCIDQVDAVDLSATMLAKGKRLLGGDAANLRWVEGEAETVELSPPYGLITAASSLHWMDWSVVLPRFARMLSNNGVLAIIFEHASIPAPIAAEMGKAVVESLTSRGIPLFDPFDLIDELRTRSLITIVGEHWTEPVRQEQSIGDYAGSFHARNGFSRERMGSAAAETFDRHATQALLAAYPGGNLEMSVQMRVVCCQPIDWTS